MRDNAIPAGFVVEEVADIRSIGGLSCVRLTRVVDGASALLHEIGGLSLEFLRGGEFEKSVPDFRHPFVTRIVGTATYGGRVCLVEPLPLCVSLSSIWQTALRQQPRECVAVLRAIISQVREAAERVRSGGREHGAICVQNVVLTDAGIYGLLQAQVRVGPQTVWIRPLPHRDATETIRGGDESAIGKMVHELVALAMSMELPIDVRQELLSLVS